jgi:hypothetical protein
MCVTLASVLMSCAVGAPAACSWLWSWRDCGAAEKASLKSLAKKV